MIGTTRRSRSSAQRARRGHLAVGVVVGVAVLFALVGAIALQRPLWESTVSLEVRAVSGADVAAVPERVELTSFALVEAARTRSVVEAAIASASVDRDVEQVKRATRIDVLTNAGSATLSVRDESATVARRLALALGREILDLDLLEPQARLVVVTPATVAFRAAPRRGVGGVLAIAAAMAAGTAAVFASSRFGSRIRGTTDLSPVADRHGIAVVEGRTDRLRPASEDPVLRLGRTIGAPPDVTLRSVGAVEPDDEAEIASRLDAGASVGPRQSPDAVVLVTVRGTPIHLLEAAVAIVDETDGHVGAVVVL